MNAMSNSRRLHAVLHGPLHAVLHGSLHAPLHVFRSSSRLLLCIAATWSASACAQQQGRAPSTPSSSPIRVIIETTHGSITVDVDSAHAPMTAANFLRYVDGGF